MCFYDFSNVFEDLRVTRTQEEYRSTQKEGFGCYLYIFQLLLIKWNILRSSACFYDFSNVFMRFRVSRNKEEYRSAQKKTKSRIWVLSMCFSTFAHQMEHFEVFRVFLRLF